MDIIQWLFWGYDPTKSGKYKHFQRYWLCNLKKRELKWVSSLWSIHDINIRPPYQSFGHITLETPTVVYNNFDRFEVKKTPFVIIGAFQYSNTWMVLFLPSKYRRRHKFSYQMTLNACKNIEDFHHRQQFNNVDSFFPPKPKGE